MKKTITPFKYVYFVLIGILIVQACNNTSSVDKGSEPGKPVWLTDLNVAYEASIKDRKFILVYFTEHDTCRKCVQLEKEILSTPAFHAWADKNVVLMKIDALAFGQVPSGKEEQNVAMAQSLKVTTYPTLWVLNITHEVENGRFKVKPIGFTGYHPSPEKLIGALQNFIRR